LHIHLTTVVVRPRALSSTDRHIFLGAIAPYRPIDRHGVSCVVTRLARRAGIDGHVDAHRLRHGTASAVLPGGDTLLEAQPDPPRPGGSRWRSTARRSAAPAPAAGGPRTYRGHGRTHDRRLATGPATGIAFPGAAQVFRSVRYTGGLDGQRTTKEVVHGVTNLRADHADADSVTALVRGSIENSVHHVRDVTYAEDACRTRTGHALAVLAALRNTITTALRLAGAPTNTAAAARRVTALNPRALIRLLTKQIRTWT